MDLFDVVISMLYPSGQARARPRSPGENVAAAIALFVLPLVEVAATVLWHLKDPQLVCVVLPLAFGALAFLVTWALAPRVWLSLGLAFGCAFTCFLWGCCVVLLNLMTWSY